MKLGFYLFLMNSITKHPFVEKYSNSDSTRVIADICPHHSCHGCTQLLRPCACRYIPYFWRPVFVVSVPKPSRSNTLAERFRSIAPTLCGLKPTGCSVQRCKTFPVSVPDDPLQFAHKPNRFTADAADSPAHHNTKSLNASATSV